jgi:hypothetical protein
MLNVGKKMRAISALLVKLVGVAGFEPATPSSRTRHSTTVLGTAIALAAARLSATGSGPLVEGGGEPPPWLVVRGPSI